MDGNGDRVGEIPCLEDYDQLETAYSRVWASDYGIGNGPTVVDLEGDGRDEMLI